MTCTLLNVQAPEVVLDHYSAIDIMISRACDLEPPSHLVILGLSLLYGSC